MYRRCSIFYHLWQPNMNCTFKNIIFYFANAFEILVTNLVHSWIVNECFFLTVYFPKLCEIWKVASSKSSGGLTRLETWPCLDTTSDLQWVKIKRIKQKKNKKKTVESKNIRLMFLTTGRPRWKNLLLILKKAEKKHFLCIFFVYLFSQSMNLCICGVYLFSGVPFNRACCN